LRTYYQYVSVFRDEGLEVEYLVLNMFS